MGHPRKIKSGMTHAWFRRDLWGILIAHQIDPLDHAKIIGILIPLRRDGSQKETHFPA
jgi:hypothetical protein